MVSHILDHPVCDMKSSHTLACKTCAEDFGRITASSINHTVACNSGTMANVEYVWVTPQTH